MPPRDSAALAHRRPWYSCPLPSGLFQDSLEVIDLCPLLASVFSIMVLPDVKIYMSLGWWYSSDGGVLASYA